VTAEPTDTTLLPPPRRTPLSLLTAFIKAIRPKQATKNLFVFAAIIFAGKLTNRTLLLQTLLAFVLFTAVSGSIYLLNDILDVEQDRLHPKKRNRPIASGSLPVELAMVGAVLLAIAGVGIGFSLRPLFGAVLSAYLVLQIAYCFSLKHIVLLDVFAIAIGFVLRTVAGGLATHIPISHWLTLCSLQLALFLGFGKRRRGCG
jgi:4-hydroxybenzoate polyprenyltransferase